MQVKIDIGNEEDSEWRIDVKKIQHLQRTFARYCKNIPRVEMKGKNVLEHKAKSIQLIIPLIFGIQIKLRIKQQHSNLIEKFIDKKNN